MNFNDFVQAARAGQRPIAIEDALTVYAPAADYRERATLRSTLMHHLRDNPHEIGSIFVPGYPSKKRAPKKVADLFASRGIQPIPEQHPRPIFNTSKSLTVVPKIGSTVELAPADQDVMDRELVVLAKAPIKIQVAANNVLRVINNQLETTERARAEERAARLVAEDERRMMMTLLAKQQNLTQDAQVAQKALMEHLGINVPSAAPDSSAVARRQ